MTDDSAAKTAKGIHVVGKTRNWKIRNEIEKNEVGKFELKLENFDNFILH